MNKISHMMLALCLVSSGSLVLAQNAVAMDDMDKGSMTMEKGSMDNGAMMKKDAMHKDDMDKGMMEKKDSKKMMKKDKTMHQDKMEHDSMDKM